MWKRRPPTKKNKFGAKKAAYKGYVYHSQKEARYAAELDLRVKAGELRSWKRQVPIHLRIGDKEICTYLLDFIEVGVDGVETAVEIKGFETDVWRLKWKLFEALYPDMPKRIIR